MRNRIPICSRERAIEGLGLGLVSIVCAALSAALLYSLGYGVRGVVVAWLVSIVICPVVCFMRTRL